MTVYAPDREKHINDIMAILGTTKPWFAPFWENAGSVVSAIGAGGNLTSSDEAAAVKLESEFSPIKMKCGLYHYGLVPGGNLHLYAADNAAFSFVGDLPFSCGLWIRPNNPVSMDLIAKYDPDAAEEWRFGINADGKLFLELYDASEDASEIGTGATALTAGKFVFVVATYDGTDTDPDVHLYINGVDDLPTGATTEVPGYVGMENLAAEFIIGASDIHSSPDNLFSGRIAMPFLTGKELTVTEVVQLCDIMKPMVGLT